jgi:hypothetical protein
MSSKKEVKLGFIKCKVQAGPSILEESQESGSTVESSSNYDQSLVRSSQNSNESILSGSFTKQKTQIHERKSLNVTKRTSKVNIDLPCGGFNFTRKFLI